jgi:hypothetical protein
MCRGVLEFVDKIHEKDVPQRWKVRREDPRHAKDQPTARQRNLDIQLPRGGAVVDSIVQLTLQVAQVLKNATEGTHQADDRHVEEF